MPTEDELLSEWRDWKSNSRHYYQLSQEVVQDFEYKGPQWGHPSNYAMTRFRCEPAAALVFIVQARWPEHLPNAYCADLERAIGHALIDSLAATYYPYRGCALTLI